MDILLEFLKELIIAVGSTIVAIQTLSAAINGACHIEKAAYKHLTTWIVGTILGIGFVLCGQLDFGFTQLWANVLGGAVTGLVSAGAANGCYDWDGIKKIFEYIYELFKGLTTSKSKK